MKMKNVREMETLLIDILRGREKEKERKKESKRERERWRERERFVMFRSFSPTNALTSCAAISGTASLCCVCNNKKKKIE
jgi:hypothetical protein